VDESLRSRLFVAYNAARRAAKAGRLDKRRLDRALGLALRKTYTQTYTTTLRGCSCRDAEIHPGVWCKHRLALALRRKAEAE
jgi:hypothetical protein